MIPPETMENFLWLHETFTNNENAYHCDKCKRRLSIFMLLVKSKVPVGSYFYVKCRHCKHENKRKHEFEKWQCRQCGKKLKPDQKKLCKRCIKKKEKKK